MKTQSLFFLFVWIITTICYAEDKLFFLKATPLSDPYVLPGRSLYEEIPASLLLYNQDSMRLTTIQNFASYDNRVQDVRYYYENKRIVIIRQNRLVEDEIYILHTNTLDSFIYKRPVCPESYSLLRYKMFNKDNIRFLGLVCYEEDKYLKGINIESSKETEFVPEDYKHVILSGSAYYQNRSDYQLIYTEPTNGNLRLPVVAVPINELYKRPIFPLILPDSLQVGKKERLSIIINNTHQFVLRVSFTEYNKNQLGYTTLVIYDYTKQQWYRQKIKGNSYYLNSYENWLAGVVYDCVGWTYNDNKESPGMEARKKINSKNKYNADVRFADLHIYSPGILYLFNTYTQKYIEWTTHQGDSQILLVENNIVYYRVNDEIYKVAIINGEKLGKSELLIKEPQVVDIHWAFITKE